MKQTWQVPVTWRMRGTVNVEAESADDALRAVMQKGDDVVTSNATRIMRSIQPADGEIKQIETPKFTINWSESLRTLMFNGQQYSVFDPSVEVAPDWYGRATYGIDNMEG